jgi:hypothetical protein
MRELTRKWAELARNAASLEKEYRALLPRSTNLMAQIVIEDLIDKALNHRKACLLGWVRAVAVSNEMAQLNQEQERHALKLQGEEGLSDNAW